MDMKAGFGYTMVNTVVEFEDGRRIAWQPRPDKSYLRSFIGGRIWRYELEPVEGGKTCSHASQCEGTVAWEAPKPVESGLMFALHRQQICNVHMVPERVRRRKIWNSRPDFGA